MKKGLMVICLLLAISGCAKESSSTEAANAEPSKLPILPPVVRFVPPVPTPEPKPTPEPVATETPTPEPPKEPKGQKKLMELTAYTAGYESTQKRKWQPGYNQPAISGTKYVDFETVYCERGVTVAAGKNIPLGTKVYIPSLKEWDGDGIFIVQDRGGAIGPNDLDIYFGEGTEEVLKEAKQFGRKKNVEVIILKEDG